jgi:hypothetical protein
MRCRRPGSSGGAVGFGKSQVRSMAVTSHCKVRRSARLVAAGLGTTCGASTGWLLKIEGLRGW